MFIAGKNGKELRHTVCSDGFLADAAQWRHIRKWTIDLMAAEWQLRRSFISSRWNIIGVERARQHMTEAAKARGRESLAQLCPPVRDGIPSRLHTRLSGHLRLVSVLVSVQGISPWYNLWRPGWEVRVRTLFDALTTGPAACLLV